MHFCYHVSDKSINTTPTNFSNLRIFSNFLLSELMHDLDYRTCDKRKQILEEMFLRNLAYFHAEIARIFSKKIFKRLTGR